ncbi:MAG TPA: hypothetical protein VL866_03365 [Pyrinomonadaceae bacterium]|nr:hypothetical protein [Pyrinomonadaceae bacterium]
MERSDLSKPGEKKKLLVAGVLGLVAILFLWWTFFGFGSSNPTTPRATTAQEKRTSPQGPRGTQSANNQSDTTQELVDLIGTLRDVNFVATNTNVPEARRNIFAFYEPPVVTNKVAETPTPTPTPTPPLLLASVSPSNVYAGTAQFLLEVTGDKFTPDARIYVDGRELQTQYRSAQQLSASVAGSLIASPGNRSIAVRSPDGRIYSNPLTLNVAQPPTPNYTYIGLISTRTHVDIAILQDSNTKAVVNAQRGEMFGGRFRLTSIADKEIVFTDTTLKLMHKIKMTEGEKGFGSPLSRPTPRVDAEDDEPLN